MNYFLTWTLHTSRESKADAKTGRYVEYMGVFLYMPTLLIKKSNHSSRKQKKNLFRAIQNSVCIQ